MPDLVGQIPETGSSIQWLIEDSEEWTSEEIETVVAPIREHMQWLYEKYGIVGNNYWYLNKFTAGSSTLFSARKRTWEYSSCNGKTADKCATSIKAYFAKET